MKTNTFLLLLLLPHYQTIKPEVKPLPPFSSHSVFDRNTTCIPQNFADTSQCTHGIADCDFDSLNKSLLWELEFEDNCTGNWQQKWELDGLESHIENNEKGMHFRSGAEFKNDAHHAVLWTKDSFDGDLKIEFDYTRTDTATQCVNILYIQATGTGDKPYVKDISKWKELRDVPAMKIYYENMNALHISFAAFTMSDESKSYVRARRYPAPAEVFVKKTEIPPSYPGDDLFRTGVPYHITSIKTSKQLFFKVEGEGETKLFTWDLSNNEPITEGRIGLRHMYTRSAIYRNFKVYISHD